MAFLNTSAAVTSVIVVINVLALTMLSGASSIGVSQSGLSSASWAPVFADTFDRPDGPVGPNYISGMMGTPMLNVTGHAACANTQAVAIYVKVCEWLSFRSSLQHDMQPCISNL